MPLSLPQPHALNVLNIFYLIAQSETAANPQLLISINLLLLVPTINVHPVATIPLIPVSPVHLTPLKSLYHPITNVLTNPLRNQILLMSAIPQGVLTVREMVSMSTLTQTPQQSPV